MKDVFQRLWENYLDVKHTILDLGDLERDWHVIWSPDRRRRSAMTKCQASQASASGPKMLNKLFMHPTRGSMEISIYVNHFPTHL